MTQPTKQLEFWSSDFGNAYTDRNVFDPSTRTKAFSEMLNALEISSILEIGCNRGNNLVTLSNIGSFQLVGIEPNGYAAQLGRKQSEKISILQGNGFNLPFLDSTFDLVFTAGVLIHIASADLPKIMDQMYRTSKRYVLVAEYFAETETTIEYRGHKNLLFKRNFKKLFLERYSDLRCIREGFWAKKDGFDDCNWFLFEKQQ